MKNLSRIGLVSLILGLSSCNQSIKDIIKSPTNEGESHPANKEVPIDSKPSELKYVDNSPIDPYKNAKPQLHIEYDIVPPLYKTAKKGSSHETDEFDRSGMDIGLNSTAHIRVLGNPEKNKVYFVTAEISRVGEGESRCLLDTFKQKEERGVLAMPHGVFWFQEKDYLAPDGIQEYHIVLHEATDEHEEVLEDRIILITHYSSNSPNRHISTLAPAGPRNAKKD